MIRNCREYNDEFGYPLEYSGYPNFSWEGLRDYHSYFVLYSNQRFENTEDFEFVPFGSVEHVLDL